MCLVFSRDMALPVVYPFPFFEKGFLECVTARNLKGLPPKNPFRHLSHAVTMFKGKHQTTREVSHACTHCR